MTNPRDGIKGLAWYRTNAGAWSVPLHGDSSLLTDRSFGSGLFHSCAGQAMAGLVEKLNFIAGAGKSQQREWRARCALGWHSKSKSVVRHMLHFERRPSHEEAQQIEAAYIKAAARKIGANNAENQELFGAMRTAIAAMAASDEDFYREQIEAMRDVLLSSGHVDGARRGSTAALNETLAASAEAPGQAASARQSPCSARRRPFATNTGD